MKYLVLAGRFLFSLIFIFGAAGHFKSETIAFVASKGIPAASFLVPLSGIMMIAGGLSVLLGYKVKLGAWILVLFMVPVTAMLHQFWAITDPMMKQMDMVMFMKNLAITGGALLIGYFGAGPLSLDNRKKAEPAV